MYGPATFELAMQLVAQGRSLASISRELGVNRATIRDWIRHGTPPGSPARGGRNRPIRFALDVELLDRRAYAYLLGLYLGDGCLSRNGGGWRLRIACCDAYPGLMVLCEEAIRRVLPGAEPSRTKREGCVEVGVTVGDAWLHLFPQHAPGRKHERSIVLEPWQQAIVEEHPEQLVRGLIHSDGCRCINRVTVRGKQYGYVRYFFTNESEDIFRIYTEALDRLGIAWRRSNRKNISVARREAVARLDEFVGRKY